MLSILTIPAIKLLPPDVLYQPQIGTTADGLVVVLTAAVIGATMTLAVWRERLELDAPHWQKREAERNA
jgi:hypothetical protein